MSAPAYVLNRFLTEAKPSATYKVMDRIAARRAAGAEVISLSAGEPDFDTPAHVCAAGIAAIRAGHTRYTQVAGLRGEAIAAKFQRDNGLDVDWRSTLVCSGGKQVIFNVLAATLNDGDEVVVSAPYWVSYPGQSRYVAAVPKTARPRVEPRAAANPSCTLSRPLRLANAWYWDKPRWMRSPTKRKKNRLLLELVELACQGITGRWKTACTGCWTWCFVMMSAGYVPPTRPPTSRRSNIWH